MHIQANKISKIDIKLNSMKIIDISNKNQSSTYNRFQLFGSQYSFLVLLCPYKWRNLLLRIVVDCSACLLWSSHPWTLPWLWVIIFMDEDIENLKVVNYLSLITFTLILRSWKLHSLTCWLFNGWFFFLDYLRILPCLIRAKFSKFQRCLVIVGVTSEIRLIYLLFISLRFT